MESSKKLHLEELIDFHPLSRFQIVIIVLCALVAMVDGFNTQSIALAAPEIATAWGVPASSFGLVFGSGLFGSFVGALIFGVVADHLGRKPSLLLAVLIFAVFCLITPFTKSVDSFIVIRFLTGIGLGGALPCTISITSEYTPKRVRATVVALMFCGFPFGAVVGGVAAAKLIPAFGWTSLFYAGSVIPLLLLPLLLAFVPESVRFLALKQDRLRITRILDRMRWSTQWDGEFMRAPPATTHSSIASLFTQGRALGTLLLSTTLFLSLLLTYFIINWLPIVARQAGMPIQAAVLGVAALNFGAIVGCIGIGRLVDRYGPAIPIGTAFALGAGAVALIGEAGQSSGLLLAMSFVAGILSIGAQMCTVALCATFYETALRATGVGWVMGVGRFGAIVGPVLGGMLITAGMATPTLFIIVGMMSVGSAIAVLAMGRFVLRREVTADNLLAASGERKEPATAHTRG